jgi:hypothetical protein
MSLSVTTGPQLGTVETIVTSGRGLNPDELTRMIMPKLIYISPEIPADVRAAAEAQQDRMALLVRHYFEIAQRCERTTVYNILKNAGHDAAAELVKEL